MKRKKWNIVNNLLLIVIALCMAFSIPTIVYGDEVELTEGSEMDILVGSLRDWLDSNQGASASELANQIVTICNHDPDTIKKLQSTYTINGLGWWNGSNQDSIHAKAVNIAIESVKNNTPIEDGNYDDENRLLKEISDMSHFAYDSNASTEDLKKLDALLKEYRNKYGLTDYTMRDIANKVRDKLKTNGETGPTVADDVDNRDQEREEYEEEQKKHGVLGSMDASVSHTPNEIINEGNQFIEQASGTTIGGDKLQSASSSLYNILLSIGIFLAVAIGMYLGVKFMVSTAEDKAKVKEALIPYIAGCVVIFSAFIIWKFAILLLNGIS